MWDIIPYNNGVIVLLLWGKSGRQKIVIIIEWDLIEKGSRSDWLCKINSDLVRCVMYDNQQKPNQQKNAQRAWMVVE